MTIPHCLLMSASIAKYGNDSCVPNCTKATFYIKSERLSYRL